MSDQCRRWQKYPPSAPHDFSTYGLVTNHTHHEALRPTPSSVCSQWGKTSPKQVDMNFGGGLRGCMDILFLGHYSSAKMLYVPF
jgi:hypothetical protein